MPNPGHERPARDPFTPYEIGAGAVPWQYHQLKPGEQAVVDRGVDTTSWEPVHDAFAAASRERAAVAASQSAATLLGVPELATVGVLP